MLRDLSVQLGLGERAETRRPAAEVTAVQNREAIRDGASTLVYLSRLREREAAGFQDLSRGIDDETETFEGVRPE